jgi:hypothetical protein
LKVSVDTAGRSGFLVKHVAIYSNDAITPTTSVTVMLTIATGMAGPKAK